MISNVNVEGLFPKAVSRKNQRPFRSVPHRKSKHSDELLDCGCDAPFVEGGEHDLGIAVASKGVAHGGQQRAQALEIVNLTVKYQDEPATRRDHRLAAVFRKIYDRESSVPKADS